MARPKSTQSPTPIEKAVQPTDKPDKFKMGAIGTPGMSIFSGITYDEMHKDLQFPTSIKTFKKMSYSVPVNACLNLYDRLAGKAEWRCIPPKDATAEELRQTEIINECLHDMKVPFKQVISDALSSNTFGFSVLEKVFRRRNKESGSMYNDNLIGLKDIALRSQETIDGFVFNEDESEVIGVKQNLSLVGNVYGRNLATKSEVVIPRSKIVLITAGRNRRDPYGKSLLRDVYLQWRYLSVVEELEATGLQKDLQGVPVLSVPDRLLSPDASESDKAILENLKNILRNLQANSQSGILLPSSVDPDTRQKLFSLELLSTEGGKKNYDTTQIKNYYQTQIFIGCGADILSMGSTGVGSFALGQLKSSLVGSYIEAMLDNIVEAFNRDVIRQLYELNGWNPTRACSLDYENVNALDLETLSKYYQRLGATGFLPKTLDVINLALTSLGLDNLPADTNLDEILPDKTTKSGQGMEEGLNSGTGDAVSVEDTSTGNMENAA